MELDLRFTLITNYTIENIVKYCSDVVGNLIKFDLLLSYTSINDKFLPGLLKNLSSIESLTCRFSGTKITERTIEFLYQVLMRRREELKHLTLSLFDTKISQENLDKLYEKFDKSFKGTNIFLYP